MLPISNPHFPARRFVWSELQPLPVVGPLIGTNQPPVHKQLYNELERRFSDPMLMWTSAMVGGWLEYNPHTQVYTLSPVPSDGSSWQELSPENAQQMRQALKSWAANEGVHLI